MGVSEEAGRLGRQADRSDWTDRAARAGLVAYGVVHLVIGVLAVQLAFGDRSGSSDATGALQALAEQPFGKLILWIVVVGLFLLVLWQALEAAVGFRDEDGLERVRHRVAAAGKALVYGFLGVTGVQIASGSGGGGGGGTDSMTAKLMDAPGGQLMVGAVGVAIIGFGGYLVWRGWSDKVPEDLSASGTRTAGRIAVGLGRVGHTAKGVAFGIVGVLFVNAAVQHQPKESGGLDQALREVLDQPFGPALLCLIAAGIGSYGLFALAQARYFTR
ncbi:DUF1206 domain-containing protein [Nocardioides sambongensis]|uniref:DUF1206 domain-containing protein n=1 Tax=Nocardioides sambongensis TaxID=2589074 RepID=UPI001127349D|nr:DUF1206 domain-containing protein [Nocardioides sambongensis]